MSKLNDGKHDLNDFVSDYWNRHRTSLEDGNIELNLDLSPRVSRDLSSQEAPYLTQIFGNVRSNAVKAIWNVEQEEEYYEGAGKFRNVIGEILVMTRKGDDGVEISISDNGHGIPNEHIDDVLKGRWSKRTKSVDREIRGMHLIHQAIEKLGGSVKLESEYGKGTTVYIYLPPRRYGQCN